MLRPDRTLLPNQLKTMYKQILSIIFAAVTYSATAQQINDSNTPLHLLKPDYKLAYGVSRTEDVKATMDRVLRYISSCTPAQIIDKRTGQPLTELKKIDENSQLASGTFRLTSYEWGVTYSACLAAAKATGDKAYQTYVTDRFRLLRDAAPYFRKVYQKKGSVIGNMRQVVDPHALDDCGAICAAMGERVAWVPEAVTYDEAPTAFRTSVTQRMRWSSGIMCAARRRLEYGIMRT